jgi:hypothetical protein
VYRSDLFSSAWSGNAAECFLTKKAAPAYNGKKKSGAEAVSRRAAKEK